MLPLVRFVHDRRQCDELGQAYRAKNEKETAALTIDYGKIPLQYRESVRVARCGFRFRYNRSAYRFTSSALGANIPRHDIQPVPRN